MASNSSSSISRPWVLATVGFIAAFSTYLIWQPWPSPDPAAHVQRRNAVRGRSHPRSSTRLRSSPSSSEAPLQFGVLHVDHEGNAVTFSIGPEPPTVGQIQEAFRLSNSQAYDIAIEAQGVALKRIFQTLIQSAEDSVNQPGLATDLSPLVPALRSRDINVLLAKIHLLCSGRWRYDQTAVARAFAEHCGLDRVPMDSEPDLDLGLTETPMESERDHERETGQGVKSIVYSIAEETAKRAAYTHRGIRCEHCGELPIRGIRWHCMNCPDFDLCSTCEAQNMHPKTHVFVKIRIPIPTLAQPHQILDPWYSGDPDRRWPALKPSLRKRFVTDSGFDDLQVEALYDQFTCTANVGFPDDSTNINAAIDRRAFNKAMMSPQWNRPLEPNFLYDRMFNFYDTNNDGLIGFAEYVSGIAYLQKWNNRSSLERTFRGYDVDGDGYISRRDFIRMLSAKYAVQKRIVRDVIEIQETELTRHTSDIVRSSQPISAAFAHEDVPPGQTRLPAMKTLDSFGENQVRVSGPFSQAVLPNGEEIPDSNFIRAVTSRYRIDPWPAEVIQNGMVPMSHAMNVRNRFTQADSVAVRDEGAKEERSFMVETDSRDTRGRGNLAPAEERWHQDICDALSGDVGAALSATDDVAEQISKLPDSIFERGRAYEAPAAEKDFGKEAIFQVVQEGFNDLIDQIFKEKEDLAKSVRETQEERRRFRKEIDDYVRKKQAFQEELTNGSEVDPLMATANAAHDGESAEDDSHQDLQLPPGSSAYTASIDGTNETRPSQREIAQQIHEQIAQENDHLPMDSESLEDMEADIRDRSLEDLLRQAGYAVEFSPDAEREEFTMQSEYVSEDIEHLPNSETIEEFVPATDSGDEEVLSPEDIPDFTSLANDQADGSVVDFPLQADTTQNPSSTESQSSRQTTLPMQTPFSTPSMISSSSVPLLPPPQKSPPDGNAPSKRRLEELSRLDEEEKQIRQRGGPARLSLKELEEVIDADRTGVSLRALVHSWLEWADF